jgi:hypothetical protein
MKEAQVPMDCRNRYTMYTNVEEIIFFNIFFTLQLGFKLAYKPGAGMRKCFDTLLPP